MEESTVLLQLVWLDPCATLFGRHVKMDVRYYIEPYNEHFTWCDHTGNSVAKDLREILQLADNEQLPENSKEICR